MGSWAERGPRPATRPCHLQRLDLAAKWDADLTGAPGDELAAGRDD
jgi:hypothetical protein